MVLESMINPRNAEDKPLHVFAISIIYTFLAAFFAHFLFPAQSSVLAVALITIIFVPFFQKLFFVEEKKDIAAKRNIFARHIRSIYVFSAFFLGVVVAMSMIFIFFPLGELFSLQTSTIQSFSGAATQEGDFYKFFLNNTKVMLLTFVLSILFGAGAVLMLAWNASVVAVYVGFVVRSLIDQGFASTAAYIIGLPAGLGSIALHGIPEITAYFIAGLAGGILSIGMIREKIPGRNFNIVLKDSVLLLVTAELLILAAAWIEIF